MTAGRARRAVLAVSTAWLVTGCTAGIAESQTPAAAALVTRAAGLTDADCAWLADASDLGGPPLALVVDATASRRPTGWPAEVVGAVSDVARRGGTVSIVSVEGDGAAPTAVWTRQPLMLAAASGTPREPAVVELGLACALHASWTAVPTRQGSDIVSAVDAGVAALGQRRLGARLVVVTDGYASAGPMRLDRGVDIGDSPPAETAAEVVKAKLLTDLAGIDVLVSGIGDMAGPPVAESVRRWLEELWTQLCRRGGAARCTVLRETGPPAPAQAGTQADPAVLPPAQALVRTPADPGLTRLASELFEPGSATLRPGVESVLAPLAMRLRPGGDGRADITGHVASWGSPAYRQELSQLRAAAVRDVLVGLGADPMVLSTRGAGSRERLVDDLDADGALLPDRAARNRRVDVVVTPEVTVRDGERLSRA